MARGLAALAAGLAAGTLGLPGQSAAAATGPTCVPAALNVSDVLPGTPLEVSPLPGSLDASPRTQISFLGAPAGTISAVTVSGSRSGAHAGTLRGYAQGDGGSFVPAKPFTPGEHVAVSGTFASASGPVGFSFSFNVSVPDTLPRPPAYHPKEDPSEKMHFHSRPDLEAPKIIVASRSPLTVGGYIFADPANGPGPSGPMIFDELGNLVYFHPIPAGEETTNLQVQQFEGHPVLTWWQGYVPPQGFGVGEEIVVGSSYRSLFHVHAGNGFAADLHDFRITSQGTALLTVFNPIACNLAPYGGHSYAAVTDAAFQEVDLHTGLVRREWHSLDHVRLADSYNEVQGGSIVWPFDYFHINSVEPSAGGGIVVSARNTWAVYELNGETGQVAATIGGKSSGVIERGAATAYQHDAEPHGPNSISVFDNGGTPKVHAQSRGILIDIDAAAHSAEVVAEYTHPTPLLSASQGSIQQLPNGDEFIGWGQEPYFSEFSASGSLLFDAHMPGSYESYRAYRFPWTGAPAAPPDVAISASRVGRPAVVYVSWNGDTRTAAWRVLGGSSSRHLHAIAGSRRSGFETSIPLRRLPKYLAVEALSAEGTILGASREIRS